MNKITGFFIAVVTVAGLVAVALGFRTSPFDCRLVADRVRHSGAHLPVERWMDANISRWDRHRPMAAPKHLFGYGLFVLPVDFDHAAFALQPDARHRPSRMGTAWYGPSSWWIRVPTSS